MANGRKVNAVEHRKKVVKLKQQHNHLTNNYTMKKYVCTVCAWVYDPAVGDPDSGIAPGTPFEDIPEDWVCPVCGVGKEDFNPIG